MAVTHDFIYTSGINRCDEKVRLDDKMKNAVVHSPGTRLAGARQRTSPVITRITQDVLARAQANGLNLARFRIGEYLMRAPDYRQIQRWAKSLGMVPEACLAALAACRLELSWEDFQPFELAIEDGAIVNLVWSFDRMPLSPAPWEPGLLVRALGLGYRGKWPGAVIPLRPVLPRLQTLICRDIGLQSLDLSETRGLTQLNCGGNDLTDLDLSPVPGLTKLNCTANDLTTLDLTPTPGLIELYCGENQLTDLDLSVVPRLTKLSCGDNRQLVGLYLWTVPRLTELNCANIRLFELDLSPVPGLTVLDCSGNELNALDLMPVSGLNRLNCSHNRLSELDLTPVPKLTQLYCGGNLLIELDLSPVPELTRLGCDKTTRVLNAPDNLAVSRQ